MPERIHVDITNNTNRVAATARATYLGETYTVTVARYLLPEEKKYDPCEIRKYVRNMIMDGDVFPDDEVRESLEYYWEDLDEGDYYDAHTRYDY